MKKCVSLLLVSVMSVIGLSNCVYARCVSARVYSIKRQRKFYDRLEKSNISLVLFFRQSKDMLRCNPELYKTMRQVENVFEDVSCSSTFVEGGLRFFDVNVERSNDLMQLAYDFNVKQFPSIVPFKYGVPIRNVNNNTVMLTGVPSARSLSAFITKHFTKELDENIKRRAREREIQRINYYRSMPYFWGYPYGGWYGGGCGPYGGGYGYGCYGRPYVGFGFGVGF